MAKNGSSSDNENEDTVVKIRGLPWSTTVEEILDFFKGCNILSGRDGIHLIMTKEGRPSGEAFIELESVDDVEKALKKDREYVGSRYIEVFRCKRREMEWVVQKSGNTLDNSLDDGCVRLRGLPFGCSKEEIAQFFTGLEIVPNGITLPLDSRGRSTGEAFVQFRTKDIAEKALLKHKEKIAHRYIEVFRSSLSEVYPEGRRGGPMWSNGPSRPSPYDARDRFGGPNRFRGSGGGGPMFSNRNGMGPGSFRGNFDDGMDDDWNWQMRRGGPDNGPMMGPRGGGYNNFGPGNMGGGGGYGGGYNNGPPGPHIINMRGLPFRATKQDIADFFRPIIPLSIDLADKGLAEVEFRSHDDACMAMSKDKSYMSHRYIELFMKNSPGGGGGGRDGNRSSIPGSRFKRF